MEPQVNLRVSCRGETQSFLVSDSAHTTWADVEAMVSPGPGSFWSGSWGLKEVRGAPRFCRLRGCWSLLGSCAWGEVKKAVLEKAADGLVVGVWFGLALGGGRGPELRALLCSR